MRKLFSFLLSTCFLTIAGSNVVACTRKQNSEQQEVCPDGQINCPVNNYYDKQSIQKFQSQFYSNNYNCPKKNKNCPYPNNFNYMFAL